jgi:predicted amidohydrolase YtcJ
VSDEAFDAVLAADTVRLDASGRSVQALGVRGGRIAATGDRQDAAQWTRRGPLVDFGDATITPGLIDAHSHAVSAGIARRGADLSSCRSLTDVLAVLRSSPQEGGTDWIVGNSLDPNLFAPGAPGNAFLEGQFGGPVYLKLADGHSAIADRAGLERCRVTGSERFRSNARVATGADGSPTGLLLEDEALDLVRLRIPPLAFEAQVDSLRALLGAMADSGLTTLSLLDLEDISLPVLEAIEREADLPVRLRCSPIVDPAADLGAELERVTRLQGRGGRRWIVEGVKFVLDGTIENGTAWLEEPDTVGESTTSLWLHPERYTEAVQHLAAQGIATATHAIGDHAVRYAIDTIARITAGRPATAPHRIEHIETMAPEHLEAFVSSGAIASMQPTHSTLYVWPDHRDEWSRRLGVDRARSHGFRFRELVDAGVPLALGSDWPVAPYDPRTIMADAQLRRPHDRDGAGRTFPDQALTAQQALDGFTRAAALALGWGGSVGTLDVGKRADLSVFAIDPLTARPEDFVRSPVIATALDGVVRWR